MRESTTYQAILKEGEAEGLRKGVLAGERNVLIRKASKRLGTPSNDALKMIELASEYQILTWTERVWEVETWPELLVSR
jgi:predicted transposase YdaD